MFDGLAVWVPGTLTQSDPGGTAEQLNVLRVSFTFFDVLRVPLVLGHGFGPAHELQGSHLAVVLSYGLWHTRFGGDPAIVGRTVPMDGNPYVVVGVAPRGFAYPLTSTANVQAWIPLVMSENDRVRQPGRLNAYLQGIGRLRSGISIEDASVHMDQIAAGLAAEHPAWNKSHRIGVVPLHEYVVGRETRSWMLFLLGSVGLVLLIVCANVANLILVRAGGRDREIGIRAAIGASRGRIARQLLIESLVLSTIGTLGGVVLSWWGIDVLRAAMPDSLPRVSSVALNVRVLAAAVASAALTGLAFGLLPAVRCSRPALTQTLKEGARSPAAPRTQRLQGALVVVEVALAVVLVVGAGLFIGSFTKVMRVDVGYDPTGVLMAGVFPDSASAQPLGEAVNELVASIRALPGVESAAFLSGTDPFRVGVSSSTVFIPDRPDARATVFLSRVTADYQRVMGLPIRRGRFLDDADRSGAEPVVVISDATAQIFFSDSDPLDKIFQRARVVGVVGDVRFGVEEEPPAMAYLPLIEAGSVRIRGGQLFVKTDGAPAAMLPAIRKAVHDVLPGVPVSDARPLEERVSQATAHRRLSMLLLGLFGVLGLVIAAVGVYGVMAHAVAARTREIGVRVALGATRARVIRGVLSRTAALVGTGLAIGGVGAWMLGAFAPPFLFQLEPTDSRVFAAALLVLAAAALIASLIPARRAATVDPVEALRID